MAKGKKPELVAPAGDWSSLYSALDAGADSVYFGVQGLNMRNLAKNFEISELKKVMDAVRKRGRKGYLALNVVVYDKELGRVKRILKEARNSKVDGVILWDMAVLSLAKELGLNIHLSTQASVSNFLALKHYNQYGVKRIVLARECGLSEIKRMVSKIKKEKINCQIEAFIHGAMCISISGRCFLSQYSFSKSANRGECIQPCRREFNIVDNERDAEYVIGKDYLLSPKDLCTIDFLDILIKSGINAFKIEGRMRSPEYISVVTSVYRRAIDAYFQNKLNDAFKDRLKKELQAVYNRGFSTGFYLGKPKDSVSRVLEHTYEKVYIGQVKKFYKKISVAEIEVLNKALKKNDRILCVGKKTPASFAKVNDIQINHEFVGVIKRGEIAGVKLPFIVRRNDKVFLWKKKPVKSILPD